MSRFIFVMGMARSGTTIFTHTLVTHPDIRVFINGCTYQQLENEYIALNRDEDVENINRLADRYDEKYIVLKHPWVEDRPEWFMKHFPDAHYFILVRDFESICKSWETCKIHGESFRNSSKEHKKEHYTKYFDYALNFPNGKIIAYELLKKDPDDTMDMVTKKIGVEPKFDTSKIVDGGKWTTQMYLDILRQDPEGYLQSVPQHSQFTHST